MRVRQLSTTGDYQFGQSQFDFLVNVPTAVGQVVQTSLKLWLGEFFLNINAGVPYIQGVLGYHSQAQADAVIKAYIAQQQGVVNVVDFESKIDPETRAYLVVSCTINTLYGQTEVQMQNEVNF
jgi:hypothetical protein